MLKNPIYFFERKKNKISFQKAFFPLLQNCESITAAVRQSSWATDRQTDNGAGCQPVAKMHHGKQTKKLTQGERGENMRDTFYELACLDFFSLIRWRQQAQRQKLAAAGVKTKDIINSI